MIAAGAIAGLLPLIHTYTFIVVMGIGACLTLLFRQWRAWSAFFTVALLVAAPQVFLLLQDSAMRAGEFFCLALGIIFGREQFLLVLDHEYGNFYPVARHNNFMAWPHAYRAASLALVLSTFCLLLCRSKFG